MVLYRFRIAFEDQEDVIRDIEIKPGQTFEQFHLAIQKAINFDATASAQFFTSDDHWRKDKNISFEELKITKLSQHIEDPHQKFIYEFEKGKWVMLIELFKITETDEDLEYPRCIKSIGEAPSQYHKINIAASLEEQAEMSEEPEVDDSIFYRSDDEMVGLTEEGEENRSSEIAEVGYEIQGEESGEQEGEFGEDSFEEQGIDDEEF